MKKFGLILAIAAIAGAAQAKDNVQKLLDGKNTGIGGTTSRSITYVTVPVSNLPSWDGYGSALNVVQNHAIGAGSHVVAIGWDVTLQALGPLSWLDDMKVSFENSGQTTGVWLTPGVGDTFSGTATYSSGGPIDLIGYGLDFLVDGDGSLRMEYFEGWDDYAGAIDGYWLDGTLTIGYEAVPAPGAMALFGAAGFVAARRRR